MLSFNYLPILFACFLASFAKDEPNSAATAQDESRKTTAIAETHYGTLVGFNAFIGANNAPINVYFGIPYAKPPIGKLRFEKPQEPVFVERLLLPENANAVLSCVPHATPDATQMGFQLGVYQRDWNISEDCLTMNIFAPSKAKSKIHKYPVLVLIHGGSYEIGSSRFYIDYNDIGANFVLHGIVFVAIQYRLGVMGYASTGDDEMPGNIGNWDMVQALKYINNNIHAFGGDPTRITLMGQSAGSGAVSTLGIAPASRDLFQQAIQLSGSSLSSWVYGSRVVSDTRALAAALNCDMTNSRTITECMRNKTVDELFAGVAISGPTRKEPNGGKYNPYFDGANVHEPFFPKDMPELIRKAPIKPTIIGWDNLEALLYTFMFNDGADTTADVAILWEDYPNYSEQQLRNYIQNWIAQAARFGDKSAYVAQQIFDYYFTERSKKFNKYSDQDKLMRQYTEIISDLMLTMPIIEELQMKAKHGWSNKLWAVHSDYVRPEAFSKDYHETLKSKILESYHGNEMKYIFKNRLVSMEFNDDDKQIQKFWHTTIRNFVKNGNPNLGEDISTKWHHVTSGKHLAHIRTAVPPIEVKESPTDEMERLHFWLKMRSEHPYDLLREKPQQAWWQKLAENLEKGFENIVTLCSGKDSDECEKAKTSERRQN